MTDVLEQPTRLSRRKAKVIESVKDIQTLHNAKQVDSLLHCKKGEFQELAILKLGKTAKQLISRDVMQQSRIAELENAIQDQQKKPKKKTYVPGEDGKGIGLARVYTLDDVNRRRDAKAEELRMEEEKKRIKKIKQQLRSWGKRRPLRLSERKIRGVHYQKGSVQLHWTPLLHRLILLKKVPPWFKEHLSYGG